MKVFVKGKGEVTLSPSSFVAKGGQASVYQRNGTAYKVYEDPKEAIPESKFAQLAKIKDTHVVKPIDLLVDSSGKKPVGYTMDFLTDTHALCLLFTKAFRDRNGITHDGIHKLVTKFQEHVQNVHRSGALIVDLNELNILVRNDFLDVALIDVDSYQTPGFPATVIMPSVRDYSVSHTAFSELSDWFSFAVLTAQMYLGIHPYKGNHAGSASVPSDKRLEHRMRHNISVFDKSVKLPGVCNSFDVIPGYQRAWLEAVLQGGKRTPPPVPGGGPVVVIRSSLPALKFGGALTVTDVHEFDTDITAWCDQGAYTIALTSDGFYLNGVRVPGNFLGTVLLGFTPKMGRPIALNLHNGVLRLLEIAERRTTEVQIAASEIAKSGDRFYLRNGTRVLEVDFIESAAQTILTASHVVANVMENSSKLFDGCAIQNMIGSVYVSLFPNSREGYQVRIPELDAYRIVEARFEGGVLMTLGARAGKYDRLIFRFDPQFMKYDHFVISDVPPTGINFFVTGSALPIVVSLAEDERLHAFSAITGRPWAGRVVEDPALGGDMRLTRVQGRVGFVRGGKVHTLSLK